jgi:hypothetical protein
MRNNIELYGTNDVPLVPKEVANERLELLNSNLSGLLEVHYMYQDNDLIREVQKAIRHWTQLRDGEEIE